MKCPICSWSSDNKKYRFLFELDCWRVVLAPNQSLVGRCVIHLKRHTGDLIDLTEKEILEWIEIVKIIEQALRNSFGTTMFNWSCYMNHAFRESSPNPHIHWWAVPRYRQRVEIAGMEFDDPSFGDPYDHYRWLEVHDDVHQEIADRIRQQIKLLLA